MPTKKDDKWSVDIRPEGRNGRRVRKTFSTKAEALRFEAWIKSKADQGEWNPAKPDNRRFSELCKLWFDVHGKHLKDGERRLKKLELITEALKNPIANQLTPHKFLKYRAEKEAKPKTLNNELGYVNAVFNELARTEQINYENPLKKVRPIKLAENELSFLTLEQVAELLKTIREKSDNPHVLLITKISLATGCRWGEAEGLHRRHVRDGKITFSDTKSKKNRTVPISPELEQEIENHGEEPASEKLFTGSITSFRRALERTSITLPDGQAAHVLRHTFASHFVMGGGDIVTLQRILGHSSIVMTMRYAHLCPNHLSEAVKLNPLNQCGLIVETRELTR